MTTKRLSAAGRAKFEEWWKFTVSLREDDFERDEMYPEDYKNSEIHWAWCAYQEATEASAQPRWIAAFEPKGTTPTKICEPAKRTAEIIFKELEERLKEAGVTRKTDKTLSAIPAILERLVQYAINEAVHAAADAPEGDQG